MTAAIQSSIPFGKSAMGVQEFLSGIRFGIPEGFWFRYDAQTNRIVAEGEQPADQADASSLGAEAFDIGEIEYGASLDECLEMSNGGMENLTLELTRQCNCRCAYCLYSGAYDNRRKHSDEFMSWSVVCSALRFYRLHNRKCRRAHVSFYGGEALLSFPMLKNAVEYATKLFAQSKPLFFTISTNGLLLDGNVAEWLEANPNVSVVITLNGPFHDAYRVSKKGQGTLDSIIDNICAIKSAYPTVWERQVNFICNIVSLSEVRPLRDFYKSVVGKVPVLVTGIHVAHANGQLAQMVKRDQESRAMLWRDLAKEYMATGDAFLHVLFRSRIRQIYDRPIAQEGRIFAIAKNCIPFLSNCFVSSDGSINLCEKCGDMTLGNVVEGIDKEKVRALMANAKAAFNKKCRGCWAQRLCSVCFADMDNLLGETSEIGSERCRVERENIADDLAVFTEFALFYGDVFDKLYGERD